MTSPGVKTLQHKDTEKIMQLISIGENVMTTWLPGAGRTRFGHSLGKKSVWETFIPDDELEKTIVLYFDQSINIVFLEEMILEELREIDAFDNARRALIRLVREGYRFIFVIDNLQYDPVFFEFLIGLRSLSLKKANFLFLALQADAIKVRNQRDINVNFMFQNIINIPYKDQITLQKWLIHTAGQLRFDLSDKDLGKVLEFGGNSPTLLKAYLRYFKIHSDHEEVLNSFKIRQTVDSYWAEFSKEEQHIIKKIKLGHTVSSANLIVKYLIKHNLISSQLEIKGTWINFIISDSEDVKLELSGSKILWDGFDISNNFNEKEHVFITELLRNDFISRDIAGKIILEHNNYSDWAIDKFVSRLRKKLISIGFTNSVIKTLKGKGYKIAS